jgi:excisionase family DNA binding protein
VVLAKQSCNCFCTSFNLSVLLITPQFSHTLALITVREKVMSDEILTIQELASYLKLNEKTAYRLASEGKLPGFKVGGSWRFKKEDIEQWILLKKQENKNVN